MNEKRQSSAVETEKESYFPRKKFYDLLQADRLVFTPGGCLAVAKRALSRNSQNPTDYSELVLKSQLSQEATEHRIATGLEKLRENNQRFEKQLPDGSVGNLLLQTYGSEILCDSQPLGNEGGESFALLRGEFHSGNPNGDVESHRYLITSSGQLVKISSSEEEDVREVINRIAPSSQDKANLKSQIVTAISNGPNCDYFSQTFSDGVVVKAKAYDPTSEEWVRDLNKHARASQRRAIAVAYDIGKKS